jgi:hypothetical protein
VPSDERSLGLGSGRTRKVGGSNTPHSVLGVICLGIAPGDRTATACLAQLHPPAFACAVTLPPAALGSYSQLSPITGQVMSDE